MPASRVNAGQASALVLASGAMSQLGRIEALLEKIAKGSDDERETDYDQTFVVSSGTAGPTVAIITLPRTIRHVDLELTVDCNNSTPFSVAVIDGNYTLAQCQAGLHPTTNTTPGASMASCSSNGGRMRIRDYLGGSGELTVYFTGTASAGSLFAQVRIRDLAPFQEHQERV